MRRHILPAALLGCLALAAPAAAQQPPVPTVTPVPTATPTPTPAPVQGKLAVTALDTVRDGTRRVVIAGRAWRVTGTLSPYVAGQTVTVGIYRDGHRVRRLKESLRPAPDGRTGVFHLRIKRAPLGVYGVKVTHAATPQLAKLRAPTVRVLQVSGNIGLGQRGVPVRLLQRGLSKLHYAVPRSGVYDAGTERAVLAWRKMTQRARTFTASRDVLLAVLAGRGGWKVRHPRDGHHVEADLSRQVMALIDGAKVKRIYHISSGKPSTPTVLGRFKVYRKDPGTNSHGMVHSSYFIRGYAIHGYVDVPAYNASHGCLRVPIPDSWSIYSWVRMGDVVWVEP
jgi:lipoprotein-anchoring transpeptidase ErfK/SrfK